MKRGHIMREAKQNTQWAIDNWSLTHNPFVKTPPREHVRREVFTDRKDEIMELISAILSNPYNILVYGRYGVGKTVFILESLSEIAEDKSILSIYTTLEGDEPQDLEICVLLALASAMKDWDDAALEIYDALTGSKRSLAKHKEGGGKIGTGELFPVSFMYSGKGTTSYEITRDSVEHPRHHFEVLLRKSRERYERVVIGVDEVEKRDPQSYSSLLSSCRATFDLECSFVVTGGLWATWITRDSNSPVYGTFINEIKLQPFDKYTSREVIAAYLNSARKEKIDYSKTDENVIYPFTEDSISHVIEESEGVPRVFNHICYHAIETGKKNRITRIDRDDMINIITHIGQSQFSNLLQSEQHIITVMRRYGGVLSDENLPVLKELGISSIFDISPVIDRLARRDVLQKKEDIRNIYYELSPQMRAPDLEPN